MDRETPMTVGALIKALSQFPDDTPVFSSGEFTMAVTEAGPARVYADDGPMSGWSADYASDAVPNAVLLT